MLTEDVSQPIQGTQPSSLVGPTVALIPAYNEERFIGSLVIAVRPFVDRVVVVNDGSSDRTAEIARKAGALVINHQTNQGKAAAVNTGFTYVRGLHPAVVVMLDGDGQHRADDIPHLLAPIREGRADVAIGSRFMAIKSAIPVYRRVGQHGLTLVTNAASGVRISDSQSGFRAFSAHALEALFFSQGGFSVESEMQFLVREHKLRVMEVPINVIYAERAKRNPFRHGMQVINGIMRLVGQIRPLLFFGLIGLVILAAGLLLGLDVTRRYSQSNDLAEGYAMITVLLCVVGTLLFFAGVILHSICGMLIDLRRGVFDRLAQEQEREMIIVQADAGEQGAEVNEEQAVPVLEHAHGS